MHVCVISCWFVCVAGRSDPKYDQKEGGVTVFCIKTNCGVSVPSNLV